MEERLLWTTIRLLDPRRLKQRLKMLAVGVGAGMAVWVRAVHRAQRAAQRRELSRRELAKAATTRCATLESSFERDVAGSTRRERGLL